MPDINSGERCTDLNNDEPYPYITERLFVFSQFENLTAHYLHVARLRHAETEH